MHRADVRVFLCSLDPQLGLEVLYSQREREPQNEDSNSQ